ncbi:hypothetical protein [Paeniglutamicibacter sp. Y32M11]|uniref:hypothetical protein n=1 Tax=Paeniglutamicibacter sp. Y32M11 TaxID=2853258 RepID=UPI001C52E47C|nr:hypothetical protein [Paeniglutamicibacter sp. Y32M11]QXQ10250.1 hypothetical protein KUF55_17800 [Paeniglutamicibacter sp. Y32M11]
MTVALRRVSTQTDSKPAVKIKGDKSVGIDHYERCAATFQTELTMRMNGAGDQFPVIVTIGKQTFDWLARVTKDKRIT